MNVRGKFYLRQNVKFPSEDKGPGSSQWKRLYAEPWAAGVEQGSLSMEWFYFTDTQGLGLLDKLRNKSRENQYL